jgi:adenosine/AMP kinase
VPDSPRLSTKATVSPDQWREEVAVAETTLSVDVVTVETPDDINIIIGQAHFIKTVDDLHEALVGVSPHLRFAFCESSGARLVRHSGNDDDLRARATNIAQTIGAGHSFVVLLRNGFPINVLNPLKCVPEVCTIVCATANPVDVVVAITERGRGIVGVIDGSPPLGEENDADVAERRSLLRNIGYKL